MKSDYPRILIVEDSSEVGDQLGAMLETAGFATRLVANDDAAIQELDDWHPSAILVDLRNHVQGGRRFCATLASRPADARLPVVLIGEGLNLLKRLPVTPSGLIPTPIDDDRLIVTIRQVTDAAFV